jgi:Na+-translocating ferredoxin:NAD+ oxidoreductase RnfG subunit
MHLTFGHDETDGIGDRIDYEEFNWEGIGEGLFDAVTCFD